jgi:hypothetical protein
MSLHGGVAAVLALVVIALGVALLAVTASEGGGEVGFLVGALFLVAGSGRLYLARRR